MVELINDEGELDQVEESKKPPIDKLTYNSLNKIYISEPYNLLQLQGMDSNTKYDIHLAYHPLTQKYLLLTYKDGRGYYDLLDNLTERQYTIDDPTQLIETDYQNKWKYHIDLETKLKEKLRPLTNELHYKHQQKEPIYINGELQLDGAETITEDIIIDIIDYLLGSVATKYQTKTKSEINQYPYFKELIQDPNKTINQQEKPNEFKVLDKITINGKQRYIILYETPYTKYISIDNISTDIDLLLDFGSLVGKFKDNKDNKIIHTFKFKFNDGYFHITRATLQQITKKIDGLPKDLTEILRTTIENLPQEATTKKELPQDYELRQLFHNRERIDYARKELSKFLSNELGIVIRRGLNTPYKANYETKGYDPLEIEDILDYLYKTDVFTPNSIHIRDIEVALGFISSRFKPKLDKVKFKNVLFDMKKFEVLETTEPMLVLKEVKWNYNPNAKATLIPKFLKSSLKQNGDNEEKVTFRVNGFLQIVGYLLVDGNFLQVWLIFLGIGGAGKGTAEKLLRAIFGVDMVSGVSIHEMNHNNQFATSGLINKRLNVMSETSTQPIEDSTLIRALTGYDDIPVEEKGKTKTMLPRKEVPHTLTVCNNLPKCKGGWEDADLQRMVVFEFLNLFRGTDDQNPNLYDEIMANDEEMEWLIYNGIQEYKKMRDSGQDFNNRTTPLKTRQLIGKHEEPIMHILSLLVKKAKTKDDDNNWIEDEIPSNELSQIIVYYAKKEGVNIKTDNRGGINKNTLINKIRQLFEFNQETYKTKSISIYEKDKQGKPIETPLGEKKTKTVRGYPKLLKTKEYYNAIDEMYKEGLFIPL